MSDSEPNRPKRKRPDAGQALATMWIRDGRWVAERPATPDLALTGSERPMLRQFLDLYRAGMVDRMWGLDQNQMHQRLAPSTLTLAGLLGHMAFVERFWFIECFGGQPLVFPVAFDRDPDAEMTRAATMPVDELVGEFWDAVAVSREIEAHVDSLDDRSAGTNSEGESWSLRWIMLHMIEEYARHCGHADLIRESIDGDVVS